jgi:hypothetical protein
VPRGIRRGFGRAGALASAGLAASTPRKVERKLGRADQLLARVERLIERKRRRLSDTCADALGALVVDARSRVQARQPD